MDFYSVQNGLAFCGGQNSLAVASPDAPLIWMGTLRAHPIRLMGEGAPNNDETYSWVMNNFWETNFRADLGGFYQFHYSLEALDGGDPKASLDRAETMAEGIVSFYRFEERNGGSD